MLAAITYKQEQLAKVDSGRVRLSLGAAQGAVDAALDALAKGDFLQKLWRRIRRRGPAAASRSTGSGTRSAGSTFPNASSRTSTT